MSAGRATAYRARANGSSSRPRMGVRVRGTVCYSDQLQILVKWDNGRSESLRPGVDGYRKVDSGQPGPGRVRLPTST